MSFEGYGYEKDDLVEVRTRMKEFTTPNIGRPNLTHYIDDSLN